MAGGSPTFVKFAYDDRFLYVAMTVTMFEPAQLSKGTTWAKDDGVEICVAGRTAGGKPAKVKCCGVVVKSEPEGHGYRTVIHFVEMTESDCNCLEAVTKANKMRCDYCANC